MSAERRRLDKWLWFARFAKTRSLAARLVAEGHVRINGRRADTPAKGVAVGDVLTVAAPHGTSLVRVLDLGERRGPAPEARLLYADLDAAPDPPQPGGHGGGATPGRRGGPGTAHRLVSPPGKV